MTQTEKSLLFYAEHPDQIDDRISMLKGEWDIERTLEANASILELYSLFISAIMRRRLYILLGIAVVGFLLQHAIQGWCPPVSVFRRLGIRTKEEIQLELYGLRMLKGDFDGILEISGMDPRDRVKRVIEVLST
ncbi:MAG TPA: hypothetical protein PLA83_07210 [Deltaproteobacteria bacterium]|nr:hypothetical protein [Deltaproteobacteria bacterium]HQJ08346.1 hypothetical protein [Deltaproteobacteria bacterium]